MKHILKTAVVATTLLASTHVFAQQIMLYQNDGWRGRAVNISGNVNDLRRVGFNDLASSVVVERGQWEVCDDVHFRGNCRVLRRGNYESLSGMGLNDRISSLRPVGRNRRYNNEAPAPLPQATYEYRRRFNERVYEARVTSVRAVVGQDEQRCWVDRQQVTTQSGGNSTAGALAGALIGGVLGHQVGDGRGRDYATAGGAVAGAVVGSRMGSGGTQYGTRDVQRCETVASTTPTYWDVNYVYRGIEHRVQLAHAPGDTIPVNRDGLPRM